MDIYQDYVLKTRDLYFKHQITKCPNCNAFAMHTHNMYELLYFVSGNATFVIEDRRYKLKKGDLLLIRPMKYHFIQIDASEDYERYDILFDERVLDITNTHLVGDGVDVINISSNSIAEALFKKLDYYSSKLAEESFYQVTLLLIKELFFNLSIKDERHAHDMEGANPIISDALKYINDNLFTLKNISEISEHLFITESYLFRLFKQELKKSPRKYIKDKRLLAAQSLIQMGEKPTEIFERCGFGDYSSFYRNYKDYFGYPPSNEEEYSDDFFFDTH